MPLFKDDDGTAHQITSAAGNADVQIWRLGGDCTAILMALPYCSRR
ncbi:hypothetical protein [Streptomyces guryensis]|uniref:Uncharacterized protein n=1 Tax=Streptomyces guryensis TaxID=2886947 RepID=A0A9Q3VJI5_9ACTN|nr:hypothetical protein [Streptomyces guryensis]MCD9873316.1 hypothetical protein [Streptomyces guryensis]